MTLKDYESFIRKENSPPEQAGFRKVFSIIDIIHTLQQVIQKIEEYKLPLCLAFVGYEKAFDSTETWAVLQAHQRYQVDCSCLPLRWRTLSSFGTGKDLASTSMASTLPTSILKALRRLEDLSTRLERLNSVSQRVGLKLNMDKTKIMSNAHVAHTPVRIENTVLGVVDHYIYLGQSIQLVSEDKSLQPVCGSSDDIWIRKVVAKYEPTHKKAQSRSAGDGEGKARYFPTL
ncbi:uncharacterized protein LOC123658254 [Melitaea cinxia]|uniref:uncharacterized protein LOC123658254 n=1 Tax=Melitaea cinxia TaxID=113334 RepID=UPI001E274300|nr:uncharacterized protein LOC123658254 [Melitaea cinxia]